MVGGKPVYAIPKSWDELSRPNNTYLWNVIIDVHELTGAEVANRAYKAIVTLASQGYIDIRDEIIWPTGYVTRIVNGVEAIEPLPQEERLRILSIHLRRIMFIGLSQLNATFTVSK